MSSKQTVNQPTEVIFGCTYTDGGGMLLEDTCTIIVEGEYVEVQVDFMYSASTAERKKNPVLERYRMTSPDRIFYVTCNVALRQWTIVSITYR